MHKASLDRKSSKCLSAILIVTIPKGILSPLKSHIKIKGSDK